MHRVRVARALQRRLVRLERQQGLVDLGPWGPADQRRRGGEQLRDRVVEQDERQDGHNVREHCVSFPALWMDTHSLCFVLSLKSRVIGRPQLDSLSLPHQKASLRVYIVRVERWHRIIVHIPHPGQLRPASIGQPAPAAVEYSSRVPPWDKMSSLSRSPPSTSLSLPCRPDSLGHSSWPELIMPLRLGGTSLKPFLGFPSFLLVSATADSLGSNVEQAAEPQIVRAAGPSQVLGEDGTECRGRSTRTRAVLSSSETSVVSPAPDGGSVLLLSPPYVIFRTLSSPLRRPSRHAERFGPLLRDAVVGCGSRTGR